VSAGKVLGGKGAKKGKFPGKDRGTDDLAEFLCVGARRRSAPGYAEQLQALLLGLDAGSPANRPDRE
jgi:hypothetical protein